MIKRKYANMRIYDYNIDFEDVENTITYSLSAKNLENNLNKREEELCNKISDLEAKLAESDAEIERFKEINSVQKNKIINIDKMYKQSQEEQKQLKQQIAEKEKEETKRMEDFEKGCQEYYKSNQTAIERLEKVKERMKKGYHYGMYNQNFIEYIDNQINELKGKVEDE